MHNFAKDHKNNRTFENLLSEVIEIIELRTNQSKAYLP